jgi:hypothetical protein
MHAIDNCLKLKLSGIGSSILTSIAIIAVQTVKR